MQIFDFSAYFGLRNKDGRAAEQQEDEREIMKNILYVITLAFTALIVLHVINVPVIYALLSLALGAGISQYYPPFIFSKILPSGDIKGELDGSRSPEDKLGADPASTSSLQIGSIPGERHGY